MIKKIIYWVCYAIFLISITVISLELLTLKFIPDLRGWHEFMVDPDHRMQPNEKKDINDDGIRSYKNHEEYHHEDFNVIFLGDSFTYAMGLSSEESIPSQFETIAKKKLGVNNINAINFGWVSSSPLLSYRLLKDIGKKYKPDLIILILDMSDFYDDILYQNIMDQKRLFFVAKYLPSTTAYLHYIVRYHLKSDKISNFLSGLPVQRYFVTEYSPEKTLSAMENTKFILQKINRYAEEELGADFVNVVMPRYFQYNPLESPDDWSYNLLKQPAKIPPDFPDAPFNYFKQQKNVLGFPSISLLEDFKSTKIFPTTLKNDPHLNPNGCKLAAEAIFNHCSVLDCFKSVSNNLPESE